MWLHGLHEQVTLRPLLHDELAQLQRVVVQAGSSADLGRQGDGLARAATGTAWTACCAFQCRHPILLVDQSRVHVALAPDRWDGGQQVATAGLGWLVRDFSTLCRRHKTPVVEARYRCAVGPLTLLVDSTGIRFLVTTNGGPANMGCRAAAKGSRPISPWIWPRQISALSSSHPAATATARKPGPDRPDPGA